MKVYQSNSTKSLSDSLNSELVKYRQRRGFECDVYLRAKTAVLSSYMNSHNIKNIIISLSGGVDSALVAAMLKSMSDELGTFKVYGITSPSIGFAVRNQDRALVYAKKQASKLNIPLKIVNIGEISSIMDNEFGEFNSSDWAKGQLVPYMRTPLNYYYSTLLNDTLGRTVICGTTNRDEGAYLGYVGKASDYIVDIQLISDLHKSEVYKLAKHLGVIDEILNVEPDGDMYDGRTDVEVFGTPYDFVELYLNYMNSNISYKAHLDADDDFRKYKANIENLHSYNLHKYLIGSPAVHMDVMNSGVSGGWSLDFEYDYYNKLSMLGDIHKSAFVNPIPFEYYNKFDFEISSTNKVEVNKYNDNIVVIDGLLNDNLIDNVQSIFDKHGINFNAGLNGYVDDNEVMSNRKSLYSIKFSKSLYDVLYEYLPKIQIANEPITDWNNRDVYRWIGINPLFRYIDYYKHGRLLPHYDYSFIDGRDRTLYSVVIYLSDSYSGETAFLLDNQKNLWNKDLSDKDNFDYDVIMKVSPKRGRILIFPHHLLHCGLESNGSKVLLRTDMIFRKINS